MHFEENFVKCDVKWSQKGVQIKLNEATQKIYEICNKKIFEENNDDRYVNTKSVENISFRKLIVLVSFIAKKRKLHVSTHNNKKKLLGGNTDNQTVFVC